MIIFFYLAAIVIANVITAALMPLKIGTFLIPYGTWFIGATLVLRDVLQYKYGRKRAYQAIIGALILSAITSKLLGDTLAITAASAVSFFISEAIDTEIYTKFKYAFVKRVLASGIVSSLIDSVVFIVIGLSPLISGILPWELVPNAVSGQFIVKGLMQFLGIAVLFILRTHWGFFKGEGAR